MFSDGLGQAPLECYIPGLKHGMYVKAYLLVWSLVRPDKIRRVLFFFHENKRDARKLGFLNSSSIVNEFCFLGGKNLES